MPYELVSGFKPAGDQPEAISKLAAGLAKGGRQTLLGVTGSGKTFTIANVIAKTGRTALVISHNKTLAAQLYSEFKNFFPNDRVGYFVSYYDYYQPESYIPQTDTYIEKTAQVNEKIEKMRLAATANLVSGAPSITVATVSCIYGIGSPQEWQKASAAINAGMELDKYELLKRLLDMQYERNDMSPKPGTFKSKGDTVDVALGYSDDVIRVSFDGDKVEKIYVLDSLTYQKKSSPSHYILFPARHYIIPDSSVKRAIADIRKELSETLPTLGVLEAERLKKRTNYDIEMIEELGYCNGIENYSMHFDGRKTGQPPYCLLDYLPKDAVIVVDESHVTIPQLHAMYEGDRSRKRALIENGFRLPSAFDNRPLKWEEAEKYLNNVIFVSATPADYERETSFQIVEQLVRPTGLLDPKVIVKPAEVQVQDIISEVKKRAEIGERALVTTLTKRMAEDLSEYMSAQGVKVRYLHSEIENLQRTELIRQLRLGQFDCLVGINLLREGLDIPEVSLIGILDADKEGFLRNDTSLIQTMGRAARNVNGTVILYAAKTTDSMSRAISETTRRREVQEKFNKEHDIVPTSIHKEIEAQKTAVYEGKHIPRKELEEISIDLEAQMMKASEELDFERAIELRDRLANIAMMLSEKDGDRERAGKKKAGRKKK
ncbi:MAG TPA: excinuclease ABC subunit UvrB [Candidatus Micrarchaeota archaeon]|nr:excinuclease ABC subunit UvrB [Candidatus Micrarchaeota archaeon]